MNGFLDPSEPATDTLSLFSLNIGLYGERLLFGLSVALKGARGDTFGGDMEPRFAYWVLVAKLAESGDSASGAYIWTSVPSVGAFVAWLSSGVGGVGGGIGRGILDAIFGMDK